VAALFLLAIVQTVRSAAFELDPTATQHSEQPWDEFLVHHNCFSAYYEAARVVRDVPNVYDPTVYLRPPGDTTPRPPWQGPDSPGRITGGGFFVALSESPPPFLLLPRAFISAGADFVAARAAWFAMQLLIVLGALALMAFHLGGDAGRRFAWVAPIVYLAVG